MSKDLKTMKFWSLKKYFGLEIQIWESSVYRAVRLQETIRKKNRIGKSFPKSEPGNAPIFRI